MANDHFGYIGNRRIPYPNREYIESFENLAGGMNTMIRPVQLGGNESPFMQNMSWRNGALGCRRGQVLYIDSYSVAVTCAPFLFHGWFILQEAASFGFIKVRLTGEAESEKPVDTKFHVYPYPFVTEVGVFFQYRDAVYFKAKGGYFKITWNPETDELSQSVILDSFRLQHGGGTGYVPIVQKNTVPTSGAGEPFQQENRLSYRKKIQYNGDGTTAVYHLPDAFKGFSSPTVYIDGMEVTPTDYDSANATVSFAFPPSSGQNNVEIEFTLENPEAAGSLLDSTAAIVYGGTQELCVVMGGPDAQPNAYFWSGLGAGDAMDPTYFPMNQYNLAGEVDAPITAFGKQQNMLVIFQPNAVGRAVFGIETIGGSSEETGKATIAMNYTRINAEIGCDLPGSLQLVENNLVWCNRKYGVCRLKDSSAAYENNIVVLSRKINNKGTNDFAGLLDEFKPGDDGVVAPVDYSVRSVDTGTRYILRTSNGHAYEWNYEISEWGNPSWFFHTGIVGVGFVPLENDTLFEVSDDGKIVDFKAGVFSDKLTHPYGTLVETPIDKVFWFPPRYLGGYDRLKNIMSAIFNTKSETDQNTTITYICDYSHRNDPTNIKVTAPTGTPMGQPYATISRRKPGYHNIRHLQIGLSNNEAGKDLNILSAYIYYTYRGRQR